MTNLISNDTRAGCLVLRGAPQKFLGSLSETSRGSCVTTVFLTLRDIANGGKIDGIPQ